jgi:hypothetical protein
MRSSLLFVAAVSLMAGCGGSDSPSNPDATPAPDAGPDRQALVAASLAVWQQAKAADDGTYGYTSTSVSFTGFRSITTFVVSNDVVVRRTYEAYDENNQLIESFDEQGAEVGSNAGGKPVYTIDEIYEVCRDEVLTQNPEENEFFLSFHPDGILENCLYRPLDCADDCNEGVEIATLDLNATP